MKNKKSGRIGRRIAAFAALGILIALALTGCGKSAGLSEKKYKAADMGGYAMLEGVDTKDLFLDMTVRDIAQEIEKKNTFVLYTGYETCSWCNAMIPYLVEEAKAAGMKIGYLDLRRNPGWRSNLDIDDYDLFVEHFGTLLPTDKEGRLHLYSPHVFFIKEGKIVGDHQGTVLTQENATDPLKPEEQAELRGALKEQFDQLK